MKKLLAGIVALLLIGFFTTGLKNSPQEKVCTYDKDSMIVVMRMERKVKPENVALLKDSFDRCRAEVLAKEPGCLDYSLFQSYHDSTLFCITEAWATKGAHNAHMQMEHTKKHLAEIKGINDPTFRSKTNYTYWICPGANTN
jgi:quinol monooxygenase YgiN